MTKSVSWLRMLVPETQEVFKRFTLATLLIALFTLVLLVKANFHDISDELMMRLLGGISLAAYLAVILSLVGEGRGRPVSVVLKIIVCAGAILAAYYFRSLAFLPPMAIGAAILFLGNSLFFRKDRDDVAVWDFTHKLWTAVIFTIAGSIIYVIGVFSISTALKSLFGLNIRHLVENWLLPIGLGFLAPVSWLSMLPQYGEEDSDSLRNPGFISRAVGFLGTWILAPLTLIYAAILLAYGAKILMMQQIPNGEVAKLVMPFLVIGTLTWLILDPPFILEKKLARIYQKLWFWIMIPASILLGVAVFIRIGEYGLTVDRYLLVLAVVWALGIALWFSFRPERKRDIRIIPGFAALLLALGSIGPWGADGLSTLSQMKRLKAGLLANQSLDREGHLKASTDMRITDTKAAEQTKGALVYLVKHKKSKTVFKFIASDEDYDLFWQDKDKDHLAQGAIYKRFGVDKVRLKSRYDPHPDGSYVIRFDRAQKPVTISGYEYLGPPISYWERLGNHGKQVEVKIGDYEVYHDEKRIVLGQLGQEVASFNVSDWLLGLKPDGTGKVDDVAPILLFRDGDKEISILFENFNANISKPEIEAKDGNPRFITLNYRLLIKGIKP